MNLKKIVISACFMTTLLGIYYLGTNNFFENADNLEELSNEVVEITDKDLLHDLIKDHKNPLIIFFHMDGCGFCKKMDPVFNEIVKNPQFSEIKFYSVNGRDLQAPGIVQELVDQKINGYPFFLFMNKNGYLDKHAGYKPQEDFEDKIANVFGKTLPADNNAKVRIQAMPNKANEKNHQNHNEKSSKSDGKHSGKPSRSHETSPKVKELIKKFIEEVEKIPGDCKSPSKGHREKGGSETKEPDHKNANVHVQAMPNEKANSKPSPKEQSSEKPSSEEKGHQKKLESEKKERREKIERAYEAYKKLYEEAKKMDSELIVSKEDNERVKKAAIKIFNCRNIQNMVWRAWKIKPKHKPHAKEPGSHEKPSEKNK